MEMGEVALCNISMSAFKKSGCVWYLQNNDTSNLEHGANSFQRCQVLGLSVSGGKIVA